jgi:mannose/fructose/N-acetylgalactosamine-specific phosphotransferase system component IIB
MTIALVRVDDRLIHGQVVVGWVQALGTDRIVLVDDAVSGSPWERELYALGVPPGLEVEFASVDEAVAALPEWAEEKASIIVLVPDVKTVTRLVDQSDVVRAVNLGGVHESNGRSERLTYVFLSDEEARDLERLTDRGVRVFAQDVPTAPPVDLEDLV